MSIQIRIGDYTFMSRDKEAPFVHVQEGACHLDVLPRAEAEELYRSLIAKGMRPDSSSDRYRRANHGMGNVLVGRHW